MRSLSINRDVIRILLGITGLGLGVLVYLIDRPADLIYFLPDSQPFFTGYRTGFGSLGQHLPTFLHTFSFSLITAGVLACRSRLGIGLVGMTWFLINLLFELGQSPDYSSWLVQYIPAWFEGMIVLENTASYLQLGTYDPRDVVSIGIGALLAFLINDYLNQEGCAHEHSISR